MLIKKGIEIVDLCLFLKKSSTLVIGDTHFGYEESLARSGFLLPKFQFDEICKRIEKLLKELKPKKIIVVGDLKHEFGRISEEEWRQTLTFMRLLQKYGDVVLIKGNHDTILEPIVRKVNLELHDFHVIDDIYFCHGHKIPEDLEFGKAKTIIIGHEHPAVGLRDGVRVEIYKSFLKGKFKKKDVLVLPSLSSMPEGADMLRERAQSPFLEDIDNFEVFVVEDKVYNFGKIKDIRRLNS